ncbi:uncharacterized protein BJ171DRAFT_517868 [Polychytrium aggregatum]|uniref:uncharacterized protein n=1 Tax=Polychytrium aggregatum TaxID=110093 RepID=UPI0022FE465F|nr:uncharacterized protein BJ171DRAFT_517868 [Polychytrium aggregatum]KAI9199537.1 hypothetical protein BJ171DRAFT_517868 [Polychytrium aggregatum]
MVNPIRFLLAAAVAPIASVLAQCNATLPSNSLTIQDFSSDSGSNTVGELFQQNGITPGGQFTVANNQLTVVANPTNISNWYMEFTWHCLTTHPIAPNTTVSTMDENNPHYSQLQGYSHIKLDINGPVGQSVDFYIEFANSTEACSNVELLPHAQINSAPYVTFNGQFQTVWIPVKDFPAFNAVTGGIHVFAVWFQPGSGTFSFRNVQLIDCDGLPTISTSAAAPASTVAANASSTQASSTAASSTTTLPTTTKTGDAAARGTGILAFAAAVFAAMLL